MLKRLSVAAILFAASLASAASNFDEETYQTGGKPQVFFSTEESQFPAKRIVTSNSVPVYVGKSENKKSSKSKKEESESEVETNSKTEKKFKGVTSFKSKHKKWLKEYGKAEPHNVTLKRQKPTHKDGKKLSKKEKKKAKKSKKAIVNNTLDVKTKDSPIKITVVTQEGVKKGVNVFDGEKKLFKTSKKNYAVVEAGSHSFSLQSNHSSSANAQVTLEKMKAKKLTGKIYLVKSQVAFEDADEVCELFGGSLASLSEKDFAKVVDKAKEKELVKDGVDKVWIDQYSGKTETTPSTIPQVLDFNSEEIIVDPSNAYSNVIKKFTPMFTELQKSYENDKLSKKKFKKALKKLQKKARKEMDKVKITKNHYMASVLCKL